MQSEWEKNRLDLSDRALITFLTMIKTLVNFLFENMICGFFHLFHGFTSWKKDTKSTFLVKYVVFEIIQNCTKCTCKIQAYICLSSIARPQTHCKAVNHFHEKNIQMFHTWHKISNFSLQMQVNSQPSFHFVPTR